MYILFGMAIIAFIIGLIFVLTLPKKDNQRSSSSTLNDAYLYGVWGIEQPHFNND